MSSFFIGIDAGGSKTKAVLCRKDLTIVQSLTTDACNITSTGIENASEILINSISNLLDELSITIKDIASIGIGAAGAGRTELAERLKKVMLEDDLFKSAGFQNIIIVTDAAIALEGAFDGNPGCMIIAGTGSIVFAKVRSGEIIRVGGFGKVIGDEGSGYSIGRKAINVLSRMLDGRIKENTFTQRIKTEVNVESINSLIKKIYTENYDLSSLAPIVIHLAESDAKEAQDILSEEADELIGHILAVVKRTNNPKIDLVFAGGLLQNENYYRFLLTEKIVKNFKEARILEPIYPPEIGAVLLAQNEFNKS